MNNKKNFPILYISYPIMNFIVIVLLIAVFFITFRMTKSEPFIDSVKVLDMFKYMTPIDFVKALGTKEDVAKAFIKFKIPQEYIKDPKYYPQIASYIYSQNKNKLKL